MPRQVSEFESFFAKEHSRARSDSRQRAIHDRKIPLRSRKKSFPSARSVSATESCPVDLDRELIPPQPHDLRLETFPHYYYRSTRQRALRRQLGLFPETEKKCCSTESGEFFAAGWDGVSYRQSIGGDAKGSRIVWGGTTRDVTLERIHAATRGRRKSTQYFAGGLASGRETA